MVYQVNAYRDGEWWTFEIPELTSPSPYGDQKIIAMGQARTAARVARESRDVISLWLDQETDDIEVAVHFRLPDRLQEEIDRAQELEAAGRKALDNAAELRRRTVRELRESNGLSQADAAAILGLSRQRIYQLENA